MTIDVLADIIGVALILTGAWVVVGAIRRSLRTTSYHTPQEERLNALDVMLGTQRRAQRDLQERLRLVQKHQREHLGDIAIPRGALRESGKFVEKGGVVRN